MVSGIRLTAVSLVAALSMSVISPAVAMAVKNAGPNTDKSKHVSLGEVGQALRYTPEVLSESDQIKTSSDSDSAIVAATAGATVNVPKHAPRGVSLTTKGGPTMDIQLPNANQSDDGKQIAPGVVAYESSNGAANAVQATEDGGVRMLTIIDNPEAPTTYDYKVIVPGGGHVELTSDGGAVVLDANNQVISVVSSPWAKDAHGKLIQTWFTTDGTTLTQYIKHRVRGVTYPVAADPYFDWKWYGVNIYVEQYNVNRILAIMATGGGVLAIGTAVTGGGGAPAAALGGAVIALGSGVIGWCSYKGRGMWIHIRPGVSWCNNG